MTDSPPDDLATWLPLAGSRPVPIAEHKEHTCRWVVGWHLYCALPAYQPPDGSHPGVYCRAHAALAYKIRNPKGA